jgi:Zn-dependent protease with chaperone function
MTQPDPSSLTHIPAASPESSEQGKPAGFRYYDGHSAQPHAVDIRPAGSHLQIVSPAGASMASWNLDSIVLPDFMNPPYSLIHLQKGGQDTGERLTVMDGAAHERLAPLLLGVRANARRTSLNKWLRVCAAVWLLGLLLWWGFPYATDAVVSLVPVDAEIALGEDVRDQVGAMLARKNAGKVLHCGNPAGMAALDALTERLSHVDESPYPMSVSVINSGIVNAFAAPGGAILVTSGLLEETESPEELAGILAHEMGHVRERHGLRSMAGVYGLQLLGLLFSGNSKGVFGDTAQGLALYMTTSSWSRDFERAADAHAFTLLRKAGLNTQGLSTFFERLEKDAEKDKNLFPALAMLSSHPATAARIAMLREMEQTAGKPEYALVSVMSAEDWKAVQNICQ